MSSGAAERSTLFPEGKAKLVVAVPSAFLKMRRGPRAKLPPASLAVRS
jgi:hypothetical protein